MFVGGGGGEVHGEKEIRRLRDWAVGFSSYLGFYRVGEVKNTSAL